MTDPELDETAHWEQSQNASPVGGQRRAWLTVLTGPEAGRVYPLEQGEFSIGRNPQADIHLGEKLVSRDHTRIDVRPDGTALVWDCNSRNGTMLGTKAVGTEPRALRDGAKLHIGGAIVMRFSFRDHLEEHFERKLYDSATRDGLTGAFNKRYFADRLRQEFAHADRHGRAITLVLFDLDDFKRINDNHGHAAGDSVLRRTAERVEDALRDEEILCRYGGEEFVVLLTKAGQAEGLQVAERLRRTITGLAIQWDGRTIPVSASFGVASTLPGDDGTPESLFQAADECLYRAKRSGKNRVCGSGPPGRPRAQGLAD